MKRFFVCLLLLLSLVAGFASPGDAAPLVLVGKSYATNKQIIPWPFIGGNRSRVTMAPGTLYLNVQPTPAPNDCSAKALGSNLSYLEIRSVDIHLGQHVDPHQAIFTYTIPLENRIEEKKSFSSYKLDSMLSQLSSIDASLLRAQQKQNQIKKGINLKATPSSEEKYILNTYDSLIKQRDALRLYYDLTLNAYNEKLKEAKKFYGNNFDYHKFPKSKIMRTEYGGTVLWINSSLQPGMIFTKRAKLVEVGTIDPILVKAILYEMDLPKAKVGDKVSVTFDSIPNRTYLSKIDTIHYISQSNDPQQPVYYEVDLSIENHDMTIKEGLRCKITLLSTVTSK